MPRKTIAQGGPAQRKGIAPAHVRDFDAPDSIRRRAVQSGKVESSDPSSLPLMTPILIHEDSDDHRQGRVHANLVDNGTSWVYTVQTADGIPAYKRYLAAAITEIIRGTLTTECAICGAVTNTVHMGAVTDVEPVELSSP